MRSTTASARFALTLLPVALWGAGCASDGPEKNGSAGSGVVAGSAGHPSAAAGTTSGGANAAGTSSGGAPSSSGGSAGTSSGGAPSSSGGSAGTSSGGANPSGSGAGGGGQAGRGGNGGVGGAVSGAGAGGKSTSAGAAGTAAGGQGGGSAKAEAELDGAGWPMKCTKPDTAPGAGDRCWLLPAGKDVCPQGGYTSVDRTLRFGGTTGVTYEVTIRFQGTHEAGDYRGGMADPPQLLRNGTHIDGGLHTWLSMEVSSPAAVYNPNSGGSGGSVQVYDYTATILIDGGATIRLKAFDSDCLMHRYCQNGQTTNCKGLVVPGISPAEAPIDGGFLQMTVQSVVPK